MMMTTPSVIILLINSDENISDWCIDSDDDDDDDDKVENHNHSGDYLWRR